MAFTVVPELSPTTPALKEIDGMYDDTTGIITTQEIPTPKSYHEVHGPSESSYDSEARDVVNISELSGPTNGSSKEETTNDATDEAGVLRLIADQWAQCIQGTIQGGHGSRVSPISQIQHKISQRFARYGLERLFEQLSDVCPIPSDNDWFREVFANYDRERTGFIGRPEFEDIVLQYYRYHRDNNRKKNRIHGNNTAKLTASKNEDSTNGTRQFKSQVVYPIHRGSKKIWQDYTFQQTTGKGSFGTVDVVVKKTTGKKRACKTIVITSREHGSLVQTEIDLMKRLNHPNILRLVETYTNGYVVNIITELCEGGQLFERLAPGKAVTEGMVSRWLRQVVSALSYIHKLGVAHRDVKPENLLFLDKTPDSGIKLIDFGLSSTMDQILATRHEIVEKKTFGLSKILSKVGFSDKLVKSNTKTKKRVVMQRAGTPHYMAPEMIKGEYDQSCDMFSLGVILYQCLTGTHPFFTPGADTEQNVRSKILTFNPKFNGPLWEGVSPLARDLCQKLLIKQPRKRISSTAAMDHPWIKPLAPAPGHQSVLTASILDNLNDWKNMSSLKQAVLHMVASRLSETEIADLRRHFEKLDTAQTGSVSLEDLRVGCQVAGLTDKFPDIEKGLHDIVQSLDYTGKGLNIGYNEFISALLTKRKSIEDKEILDIFNQFDVDGKGYLTTKELQSLLKINKSKDQEMASRLESVVEQKVTLSEFMDLVRG